MSTWDDDFNRPMPGLHGEHQTVMLMRHITPDAARGAPLPGRSTSHYDWKMTEGLRTPRQWSSFDIGDGPLDFRRKDTTDLQRSAAAGTVLLDEL